jgi:hypothetical protein
VKPRLPIACLFASLLLPACVDLSSPTYRDPSAAAPPDASVADAVSDVGNRADALVAECRQCLTGPACASVYDPCTTNATCTTFATCVTDTSCWASSLTDLTHLSPCLVQCSIKAGITSMNDPATAFIGPLYGCAQDPMKCGSLCDPGAGDM